MKKSEILKFSDAFKFPFNRWKGLLNILWIFLPIFGWFALGGYGIRIVQGFTKGKFKELPVMTFGKDMKFGFFMFLKAIPFIVAYFVVMGLLGLLGGVGTFVNILIDIFVIPMLVVNFMSKQTMESLFEFRIVDKVFSNFGDYVVAMLKEIGLGLVFLVLSIVLVGIPAGMFAKNIFVADFYRRRI